MLFRSTVRQHIMGNQVVEQQWDGDKQQWVALGAPSPRWEPGNGPVGWGAPYQDPNTGAWVQKSTRGEIRGIGGGGDEIGGGVHLAAEAALGVIRRAAHAGARLAQRGGHLLRVVSDRADDAHARHDHAAHYRLSLLT